MCRLFCRAHRAIESEPVRADAVGEHESQTQTERRRDQRGPASSAGRAFEKLAIRGCQAVTGRSNVSYSSCTNIHGLDVLMLVMVLCQSPKVGLASPSQHSK